MKNTATENCMFLLLILILSTIPLVLYYDLKLNNQFTYIVETPLETIKPNNCIFNLFGQFFKVSDSTRVYCPSYFTPIKMISVQQPEYLSMLNYIRQEQYVMFIELINLMFDNLGTKHNLSN